MPIRIYALAKELNLDSKELVEVCTKAGISGKGSALASLDDDEVTKVRAYLETPKSSGKSTGRATAMAEKAPDRAPPSRESFIPAGKAKKIRVIPKVKVKSDETNPEIPEVAEELEREQQQQEEAPIADLEETADEADEAAVAETDETGVEEPGAEVDDDEDGDDSAEADDDSDRRRGSPLSGRVRPKDSAGEPDPLAPKRTRDPFRPNRPPTIGGAGGSPAGPTTGKAKPKRRAPVIKLPDLPNVAQPTASPKKEEPAQKPVIGLTTDAFANRRQPPINLAGADGKGPANTAGAATSGDAPLSGRGRKGRRGGAEEDEEKRRNLAALSGERTRRQANRKRRRRDDRDDDSGGRRRTLTHTGRNTALPRKGNIVVETPCTVRSFSEATGVGTGEVLKTLMLKMQVQANINSGLDDETAQLLAVEIGLENVEFWRPETAEDQVLLAYQEEDDESTLEPRPPIVTFLGHVDHGKTSLLDALIGINVVKGEAGGITQHIRAYNVETKDGRSVSFVDTPGHEAFTEMRARGANVTDIVVLVVAADDGIMPQTEEAISHAKAADVPIVVALNKMDLPGADPTRVMTQMTEHELTPSEWGGDVEVVQTSAISGLGMDDLLETLLTLAELEEYTANPNRQATGTCLEAEQEPGRGVIAKLIVRNGTLKVGDNIVCGSSFGRIKAMYNTLDLKKRVPEATPSVPVNVTGFDTPPGAGETFYVVDDIATAREVAERRADQTRDDRLVDVGQKWSFAQFQEMLADGNIGAAAVSTLNLIIRADVRGSIEAIVKELDKFQHPEVAIKKLQTTVGGITVGDVQLAHASQAVIVGFNVIPDEAARSLADDLGVEIRRYEVIYKLAEDIKLMVEGQLKPEERVIELGRAVVKEVFNISRVGSVAGCYVIQGAIERGCRIRVNRDGRTIGDYPLESLKRIKDDVKEVPRGMECGIKLSGFNDIKSDDLLEAYRIEEVARSL